MYELVDETVAEYIAYTKHVTHYKEKLKDENSHATCTDYCELQWTCPEAPFSRNRS